MSPSKQDKLITELAEELYAGYRKWELVKRKSLLVVWLKLPKQQKQGWKKLAEMIITARDKELEVVN